MASAGVCHPNTCFAWSHHDASGTNSKYQQKLCEQVSVQFMALDPSHLLMTLVKGEAATTTK